MPGDTLLNRPGEVQRADRGNMIGLCERLPEFCRDALERTEKVRFPRWQPRNLVVAGMGGSAIGGELLKDWLYDESSIPVEVCRDYALPAYVDEESLVIAVSYSGETEETLSAFLQAVKRGCMVVTVASGGHLQSFSRRLGTPHVPVPQGFHPRAAIAYLFCPLVKIAEKVGVYGNPREVEKSLDALCRVSQQNALAVPLEDNKAKKLASDVAGAIPMFYGFRQYSAVARRLKCQFNENSKVPSKFDVFPELNHNEVVGWEAPDRLTKVFSAVFIRDPAEPPEIRQRIETTKQIIAPKVSRTLEIQAEGRHRLARMLTAMYIGDFASLYLAVLRGVDPAPTKTIAHLKQEIRKKLDMTADFEKEVARHSAA